MSAAFLLSDAVRLHQSGQLAAAAEAYVRVLAQAPLHPDALHLLGVVRAQGGQAEEAVALIAQAAALNPISALYRGNLVKAARGDAAAVGQGLLRAGDALFDAGAPELAARCYRAAVAVLPDDALAWGNLAAALRDASRPAEALAPMSRAAALGPGDDRIAARLGGLHLALRDGPSAEALFRALLERDPGHASARVALADAVKTGGRFAKATGLYRKALAVDPADADGWFNLGVTLGDLGRHEDTVAPYRRAVRLSPGRVDARFNLAHALLITGRYEEGWPAFEARFERDVHIPDRGRPWWRGEPLQGRTILLYGEQGHGDALQFIRYAPMVARAGGRVVVECLPALARLFARVEGVAEVHPLGGAPDFDLIAPLMSLPALFGTTLDTVPAAVPYLDGAAAGEVRFAGLWPPGDGTLAVGLVWAGDPHVTDPRWSHADTRRSIQLAGFAPLLDLPGLLLVSLQKGAAAAQAAEPPFAGRILDVMADVADFADTAALVRRLDLVISVDTSVAHLAGALGVPVWVLSRFDGCWRWLTDREDSPWYPTARVFRQERIGDWQPVLDRVATELRALAAARLTKTG
ncbi:tetratricopeptide repeat-containing glycosyltransferase family protein [Azospirillum canadense]|uniref:tetratricopeptide repeat-containing glycosyltransferase family protein n=1 Tax=Azospirillum canadense TaxID=403962 RepID=UPI002226BF47|nr:tetratricopeptide repeat-containing glycosyltransferase family protein [Azospirillum canadense]MCW2236139.1 tetratricopeptide (TPR) repeat protein [Azospirillum canadense]